MTIQRFVYTCILLLLSSYWTSLPAQGQNFEKGFIEYVHQVPNVVSCNGEYTYVAIGETFGEYQFSDFLVKMDTMGNRLWTIPVEPMYGEVSIVTHILHADTHGIIVGGWGFHACDVPEEYFFVMKYSRGGTMQWKKIWGIDFDNYDPSIWPAGSSGPSLTANDHIVVQIKYMDPNLPSSIMTFDLDSTMVDSFGIHENDLKGFEEFATHGLLAHKNNSLWKIVGDLNAHKFLDFSSEIRQIKAFNNSLYVLTVEAVFILDDELNIISQYLFGSDCELSNLKIYDEHIRIIDSDSLEQTIYTLDHQLNISDSITLHIGRSEGFKHDFSTMHYVHTSRHPTTGGSAIRIFDYSLTSDVNSIVDRTDVALLDISLVDYNTEPSPWNPGKYNVKAQFDVLIKNNGQKTLNSTTIYQLIGFGICGAKYFSKDLDELNLIPGDSMWIDLEWYSTTYGLNLQGDTLLEITPCIFSNHANGLADLNVPNDEICKSFLLDYSSVRQVTYEGLNIVPNPAQNHVLIQSLPVGNYDYQLSNIYGQTVMVGKLQEDIIHLTHLPDGVYYLRISDRLNENIYLETILKVQ